MIHSANTENVEMLLDRAIERQIPRSRSLSRAVFPRPAHTLYVFGFLPVLLLNIVLIFTINNNTRVLQNYGAQNAVQKTFHKRKRFTKLLRAINASQAIVKRRIRVADIFHDIKKRQF